MHIALFLFNILDTVESHIVHPEIFFNKLLLKYCTKSMFHHKVIKNYAGKLCTETRDP